MTAHIYAVMVLKMIHNAEHSHRGQVRFYYIPKLSLTRDRPLYGPFVRLNPSVAQ